MNFSKGKVDLLNNVTAHSRLKALGCYVKLGKCRFTDVNGAYFVAIPIYSEGVNRVVGELVYEAFDVPAPYLNSVEFLEYVKESYRKRTDYSIDLRNSSTLDYIYESNDFYY